MRREGERRVMEGREGKGMGREGNRMVCMYGKEEGRVTVRVEN